MLKSCLMRIIKSLQFLLVPPVWLYSKLCLLTIRKKKVPPISDPLLLKRASELAEIIRSRKVSCTEIVTAYIKRIRIVEPIINSVVQERFDEALKEAKQVDMMLAENSDQEHWSRMKPLLGVPMSFKETIAVAGMSNNGGRLVPKERIAKIDSEAVKNLREAGVIPVAVTNTPELCLFWETYNMSKGITRNPYNTRRSAGGSSGGECALISSGGSVIGLGSDIAGSGRLPPMFCGTFGHKPTPRIISVDGHMPSSNDEDWDRFLVFAPLSRYSSDLSLILKYAAPKQAASLKLDEEVDLSKLRILYMEDYKSPMMARVTRDTKEAVEKSANHFQKFGIKPKKVTIKNLDLSVVVIMSVMLNMSSPHTVLQKKEDDLESWSFLDVLKEIVKKCFFCSSFTMYSIMFCLVKKAFEKLPERKKNKLKEIKSQITKELECMLGEDGVLIMPVFINPAHEHFRMWYKMLDCVYVALFNLIELPGTACPVGLNNEGLPVGVQIIANKYQDRLTLAVACELEKAFGGWTPPSGTVLTNNNTV